MNSSRPLSTVRTLWIIGKLALQRQINIWRSIRLGRKKKAAPNLGLNTRANEGKVLRSGTPTKSRRGWIFSAFILLVMGFNGLNIASMGLVKLSARARHITEPSKISVSPYTEAQLLQTEQELQRIKQLSDPVERKKYADMWNQYLDQLLLHEIRRSDLAEEEQSQELKRMQDVFAKTGAAGFTGSRGREFRTSSETWPRDGEAQAVYSRLLSLIALLWFPAILFTSLGTNNKDLGQVEWSFEWLYTFPASARVLFASKFFSYSMVTPLLWMFCLPFLVLSFVAGGHGWMAIPFGLIAAVWFSILVGAAGTFSEVALRKFLSLGQLKNFQALFTVLGMVFYILALATNFSELLDDFLIRVAGSFPVLLTWNPLSLPLLLAAPSASGSRISSSLLGMTGLGVAAGVTALWGSAWITRDGLVRAGGPYQGSRQIPTRASRNPWLRGIAAHEMILLARDRNLLVQVLILPLLLPAYYLLTSSGLVTAVGTSLRNAAMMAFAVGAYSFLNSAMQILAREDKTLWYLLCFPQSLSSMLFKKATVWAAVGLFYGGALLLLVARFSHHLKGSAGVDVVLALYGIVLYAFIASGIGILATNVLETTPRGRFRTDMVYLYMILAAMYANTIYAPSLWTKLAQLVLSTLLAVALWQKVKDACPYLLDPTQRPPRTLSLADGMIAVLAFFVAQSLIALLLHWTSAASWSAQITIAYILAGVLIGSVTLFILWRQDVPNLWINLGFSQPDSRTPQFSTGKSVLHGAVWGLVAALGAFAYLHALSLFPEWQKWKQDSELSSYFTHADKPVWILVLAVVAAPLFEEFLFRGLVFQGLRRSTGPVLAVLSSAALFALVHPPISVIPVFGLGIVAAISFQRTGLLWSPIATHAVYNACILLFNKL
jgi:ABC-2 type transport system permease protein